MNRQLLGLAAVALLAATTKEEIPVALGCVGIWYAFARGRKKAGLAIFALGLTLTLVDFLVVFGEIAIGTALILGIATRLAGSLGALMMFLFWIAAWDFSNGIVNEQFVYGVLAAVVAYGSAGRVFGLDSLLEKADVVRRTPGLRYVLG